MNNEHFDKMLERFDRNGVKNMQKPIVSISLFILLKFEDSQHTFLAELHQERCACGYNAQFFLDLLFPDDNCVFSYIEHNIITAVHRNAFRNNVRLKVL